MASSVGAPLSARVTETFAAFGMPADQPVSYTVLLQENRIVGHCYKWQGIRAVVPAGGDTVDFYDREHRLLRTVVISGESEVRKAA